MGSPQQISSEDEALLKRGSVVATGTLLSRVTGFLRDVVLANIFGASAAADAFFLAFRVPNFFRRMLAEGAFSQGFVPVLASYLKAARPQLSRFLSVIQGNFLMLLVPVCALGVLLAPWLMSVFAPGFDALDARRDISVDVLRITFPYLGCMALAAYCAAILNSHSQFAVPALAPVLLNICLIAAALFFVSSVDPAVTALAYAVVVAGILQLGVQMLAVGRLGLLTRPRVDFSDEGSRSVVRLMGPAMLSASAGQLNSLIDAVLASFLVVGSVSWLYYSDRLFELPLGIIAVGLGTALLPSLSRLVREDDQAGFTRTLAQGIKLALLFGLPAAAGLFVLSEPLIATIFGHGALTAHDVRMAALSLEAYSVGLVALMLVKVCAPAWFARLDTKTPLRYALVAVAANIMLNLLLIGHLAHVGLALATSFASVLHAWLLLRGLGTQGLVRDARHLCLYTLKLGLATLLMLLLLRWLQPDAAFWFEAEPWRRAASLAALVLGAVVIYFSALFALGLRMRHLRGHGTEN
ncbi:MAG: murein biosynthesis integral membrane protein MurJ [Gammaproteobacteria bacterium]|nr:murein biosynthesis integral membrane protein MurJ [Gammaproteobacteria bacterium]